MDFTPEQLTKAKSAESAEELLAMAKENGVELSEEELEKTVGGYTPATYTFYGNVLYENIHSSYSKFRVKKDYINVGENERIEGEGTGGQNWIKASTLGTQYKPVSGN